MYMILLVQCCTHHFVQYSYDYGAVLGPRSPWRRSPFECSTVPVTLYGGTVRVPDLTVAFFTRVCDESYNLTKLSIDWQG